MVLKYGGFVESSVLSEDLSIHSDLTPVRGIRGQSQGQGALRSRRFVRTGTGRSRHAK